ncbi:hypothetical protein AB833_01805 [Chromatiales bacterium (ex Bugula neritina AB1)]|nr:hypothetical protein AB833_01805 [Chromatiales bacterium (ex Bugula neritina AB1)]
MTAATDRQYTPGKARRLQRMLSADGHFCIVALDQRAILVKMLSDLKQINESALPFSDMLAVKRLLVDALSQQASAMLFDPNIAVPAALDILPRDTGLLVALEHHRIEETPLGRKTGTIPDWSVEKILHLGADGVKVLIWYHPDADAGVCAHQQDYIRAVGQQCAEHELPFVLELLAYQPPQPPGSTKSIKPFNTLEELPRVVVSSVQEFVKPEYQVDLLKLESPVPVASLNAHNGTPDPKVQEAFDAVGACCAGARIPWVMLSAGVTTEQFINVLRHAYTAGAQGFLAGRAIWKQPLQGFPDLNACRENLHQHGSQALASLLEVTTQSAQVFQAQGKSAPNLIAEGDFARWYGS